MSKQQIFLCSTKIKPENTYVYIANIICLFVFFQKKMQSMEKSTFILKLTDRMAALKYQ